MKHQLKKPYIAVRTEGADSYGGNQAWLSTKWQRDVGCGLVAAQDIVSYLKGGEQVVSMEKYLEDMEQTVKFFPIKSPMGLNGFMLAWGVNRMLKKSELPFRARWSVGRKRFLKRLPEMLKDDIPALLSDLDRRFPDKRGLTMDDFHRLTDALKKRGFVKEKDIEDNFIKRCCKSSELTRSINRSYREYQSLEAARHRITAVRSVVAGQFAGLSDILHDLSQEFAAVEGYDEARAERVIEALSAEGLTVADCSCRTGEVSGMTVEIEIIVGKMTALSKTLLLRVVNRACGRYFESPELSFEGDRARVVMCEMPLYDLEIGSAQHVCDDGELCGDCLNYFVNGAGSTVALISDGMGCGGRAAVDANMAVSIMSKLCKAGLSYDCALAVTNSSLMIKSEEESLATMDLMDFNCFTGRAGLMKAGACTTYIKKNGKLLPKEMPSLPLGILNEARFSKEDVILTKDDWIVMVSDGVMIGSPEWIEKLILSWREGSAEQLAAQIVNEAQKRRKNDHDDDITAIAMRVVENG